MINVVVILVEIIVLFLLSRAITRAISRFLSIQLLSFLLLPGIIVHELAHLLTAALMFVPVGDIEFLPKVTERGVKLGSVAIGKTDPVRRALIGLAPILVGITLLWAVSSFYSQTGYELISVATAVLLYIVFEVGNTMFSSMKDLEGLVEVVLAAAFLMVIFYFFTRLASFNIPTVNFPLENIGGIVSPLVMPLTLAIVINLVLLVVLRVINR